MEAPRDIYKEYPVGSTPCSRHPSFSYCTIIRLVSIEPGSPTDPIKCTLSQDCVPWGYPFQVAEGQQTTYEALSYVWGKASVTSPILLDGYPFEVTLNLKAALEHLRLGSKSRALWVDAICINQGDIDERSQQVQAMTMIYQTAQRVIVWLGESSDGSDKAFVHLNKKALEMRPPPMHDRRDDNRQERAVEDVDPHISIATWISPEEVNLLNRPWWTRIWVVQEVAVAEEVLVQCGNSTVSWDILSQAYAGPPSMSALYNAQSEQKLPNVFQKLDFIRRLRRRGDGLHLLNLMGGYRYCLATDPRDKIFALMGLRLPGYVGEYDELFAADYAISYEDICKRIVRFFITVTANLDVLSYCGPLYDETDISSLIADPIFKEHVSPLPGPAVLPSWVPDWSRTIPASPFRLRNSVSVQVDRQLSITDDSPIYKASGNRRASVRQSADEGALILKGVLFDKVKECSRRAGHLFHDKGNREPIYDWIRLVKESKVCRHKSESDRSRAFLRTLVADFVDGKRATENDVTALDYWLLRKQHHLGAEDLGDRIKLSASLVQAVSAAWNGRRFFISEKGYMGLGPISARAGDTICILFGGQVPFILREKDDYEYSMIGECYVHGIMDGEAIGKNPNKRDVSEFVLR